jgi:hypothetical protein
MSDAEKRIEFVQRAARYFRDNPTHWTYTDEEVEPGELFAVKWGADNDCVLIFKLDECFEPTIYGQAIERGK